jgi:hypothetical protein
LIAPWCLKTIPNPQTVQPATVGTLAMAVQQATKYTLTILSQPLIHYLEFA